MPLYKGSGDRLDGKSYRPVANLCAMSKVLEKVIASRLSHYMEKSGLFSDRQHAYRRGRNCTMALLQLQDQILNDSANGFDTSIILTDMSCAFDTISHEVMLGKLKLYGANDEAINWFRSYFSNRAQYTQIGAASSMIISIIWGVFQGSILGPICFIIFMNDIVILEIDGCIIIIYADDTTVALRLTGNKLEDQSRLDEMMRRITTFMRANSLAFNAKKTQVVHTSVKGRQPPEIDLVLDGELIVPVSSARLLGLQVTHDLDQKHYIMDMEGSLLSQLSSRFNGLKCLKGVTNQQKLKELAKGIIISKVEFGLPFWGNTTEYLLNRVDQLLNDVVRLIFDLPPRFPNRIVKQYYAEIGFLQIRELLAYHDVGTLQSVMKNSAPRSMAEQLNAEFSRVTRMREQGALRMTQNTAPAYGPLKKAFLARACYLYNWLPAYNLPEKRDDPKEYRRLLRERIMERFRSLS